MSRGQGYQEVEGELSLGDLPAHLGKDDSRADVLERAPRSPDTFDARVDKGAVTRWVPRWETLRRHPFRVAAAMIVVAIVLAGGAWWWSYALSYEFHR